MSTIEGKYYKEKYANTYIKILRVRESLTYPGLSMVEVLTYDVPAAETAEHIFTLKSVLEEIASGQMVEVPMLRGILALGE